MKRKIIAVLLCMSMILPLMACNTGGDLPQGTQANGSGDIYQADDTYNPDDANIAAMNFSVGLLQTYANATKEPGSGDANLLISPFSVYFALGMLENGAKGETLSELEDVLGLNPGQMNSFAKEYMNQIPEELKIANSIWYTSHERFTVEDAFVNSLEGYFDAEVYEAAFDNGTCEEINDWVADKTDDTIKEIISEIPADAVMYLINALAFEAEWEETYEEGQIRDGVFTVSEGIEQTVDMMYSEESYYIEDENAKGFIKYYDDREYAFVALLPNEELGVFNYIRSLTGEDLLEMLENPVEVPVFACMPQFKIEDEVKLKDILEEMGMSLVFDADSADLSGLGSSTAGNLYVDEVFHKTYIEVSPVGTKAGAATSVMIRDESAVFHEEIKEVYLNRPFIYMIIDCDNNQPLFMGTVNSVDMLRCGVSDDLCGYPTENEF